MKKFLFFIFMGFGIAALYFAFMELYYYRDRVEWVFPIPSETPRIRRDTLGRGDFGARRKGGRRHQGVDLLAPEGTPVVAVRSGRARVGNIPKGMGQFVSIRHRNGIRSIYGHLSAVSLKDHSRVRQGQVIGAVGKTGNASSQEISSHLHFEMRQGEKSLNPLKTLLEVSQSNH